MEQAPLSPVNVAEPFAPPSPLINVAHVIYGCYALGFFVGLTWIIGVIIAYAKRHEAQGTWLESHFRWQIRTFWWSLLWGLLLGPVALMLVFTLVGIPLAYALGGLLLLWMIYRVARGWLLLNDRKPLPV